MEQIFCLVFLRLDTKMFTTLETWMVLALMLVYLLHRSIICVFVFWKEKECGIFWERAGSASGILLIGCCCVAIMS